MSIPVFLQRVILQNYKSIGHCDVRLHPLTWLVGGNGAGKSNFLDALQLVSDALNGSLDNALNERGGINEVRRRSRGHPTHFGIRLEFHLPDGREGHFAFRIGALKNGGYEVQNEECIIGGIGRGPAYQVERGTLKHSSEPTFPAITSDRLALVAVSGTAAFRPVFDALASMRFYNLNPRLMRDLQTPQDGKLLKEEGENIASVIGHLQRVGDGQLDAIQEYLRIVVPMIHGVQRKQISSKETLEFRQDVGDSTPWRFEAQNMSDGTLRALGVLTALFQGNRDFAPSLVGIEEPETALHPAASAALREALTRASRQTQIIVTSHSPDLLDDTSIPADTVLAVVADQGNTHIASLDEASRDSMQKHLFSAGELLRLDQLQPDPNELEHQTRHQASLFNELPS